MKEAIIMMGLPLSGKSLWILENVNHKEYDIVSADVFKETHSEYDPEHTEKIHQWSVQMAEDQMNEMAEAKMNMVMDGGGINNRYSIRIMEMLKSHNYHITLVWVKTPYQVCLDRNHSQKRERKVPDVSITDKALKEPSQFHKLKKYADKVVVEDYFTNRNIFVDMDGVIAAQSVLPIINGEIDFANGEVHKWQKPVKPIIDILNELRGVGYYIRILSATANSIAYEEKQEWLDENFNIPREDRFFVNQGRHKAEMLENLQRKFKLHKKDVLLLDDFHDILKKVRERGMNSMHPSEFMTHEF